LSEVPIAPKKFIVMKNRITLWVCLIGLLFFGSRTEASWLVDQERFHISVHGQTSCVECHGNVVEDKSHPDPGNVNRPLSDFFNPETCADCHDDVESMVKEGSHGGEQVNEAGDVENCLKCHNPHYDSQAVTRGTDFKPDLPLNKQCHVCHEKKEKLPEPSEDDKSCIACHGLVKSDDPGEKEKTAQFCFHCHGKAPKNSINPWMPFVNEKGYGATPHADLSCLNCHPESAKFGHSGGKTASCLKCHVPHDESVAHDAHVNVSCQACHLGAGTPVLDLKTHTVVMNVSSASVLSGNVHQMQIQDRVSCSRCHFKGNDLGASAMVLPAKSAICMPCHTAVLTTEDSVTRISLSLFLLGLFSFGFVVLSGSMGKEGAISRWMKFKAIGKALFSAVFSPKILLILKSLVMDSLLQRRLFERSRARWTIHGLIFYPFVLRFVYGLCTLLLSIWMPDLPLTRVMLDKNSPVSALWFDLTGMMVVVGVVLLMIYRKQRPTAGFPDIPGSDAIGNFLLAGIVIFGFVLEGIRIAMTGTPAGSGYAVLGYAVSWLFAGMTGLSDIHGYLWYGHAILTGIFLAYLPFSRMLHMIVAPILLAAGSLEKERKE
jgi:hypothetical protein